MPAVTRSRSHSRTHSPVDETSILNPYPSQTSQMSSEEILSEVRELKKLVEKLLSLREEDQATIQRMENQLQSLVGKGGDDGDEDFDLGDQTVGPSNAAAKRKDKTPERPKREQSPMRRGSTAPAEGYKNPKITIPDPYDGKSKGKAARQWWTRMAVCLSFMQDRFADENAEMIWFLQNTKDAAADWAQPLLEILISRRRRRLPPALQSWEMLEQSFLSAFGDPDAGRAAERKITALEQTGTTVDYWTEFQTLIADLSWNDSAYRAQFRRGLHWKVKEQLSMLPQDPTDLEELVTVAIRIDNARRENELDRTRTKASSTGIRSTATTKVTRTPASTEPANYVDQAEKDRRKAAGECIKCGRKGHSAKECRTGWRLSSAKESKPEGRSKKEKDSGKAAAEAKSDSSESESESGKE
ncbi:Retrotransposon-derived protein PEG10 [Ceratobasidium sp. AG-Ba]|nr:Retrotransposon-derived protein PEG10 [Ceratobasidium sp. AG-Ba]QRV78153.1 Retrotransposon-derived protein PEG10 [Ceratobasidium sp. AG-Ba]QRV79776.1 Retrotransposon-derived protein PEG10 [Ceratobasidium sp. AG-Ba]